MMRAFLILFSVLALFCGFANAQGISGGVVSIDKGLSKAPVYNIAVSSDSPELKAAATRAFSSHGSYNIVQEKSSQFVFGFTSVGVNAVKLSIKGGGTFEQIVYGDNTFNALMRACDLAVVKTLGGNGYFAGKITFASDKTSFKEIYAGDLFFNRVRQLTNDKSESIFPLWSADGTKILYSGYYRSGFMDLYELDLSKGTRRPFAQYRGANAGGAPSPDGSKVAMILTTSGNAEIWLADSNGRNVKRLTKTQAVESSPNWSPDGKTLVFASDARGGPQIYKMSVNGGKFVRVPTNISGYCSEPSFNPVDPSKIVFTAAVARGFQVAVYDAKERKSKFVTSGSERCSQPKWLADGRHIIFTKEKGGKRSLWIVDSERGKQTLLHSKSIGNCCEASYFYLVR